MRYSYEFVVPKNTLVSVPYQRRVKLASGSLTAVAERFRAGCYNRTIYIVT